MVPASFDFWLANLNREASSAGTSIPSDSLNPTDRPLLGVVDGVHRERGRNRRRLQTDRRNGVEIHGIRHDALPKHVAVYVGRRIPRP
jgi:hypothetical protein